jgi:hypothetical protein
MQSLLKFYLDSSLLKLSSWYFLTHRKIRLDAELERKVFLVKHNELQLKNGDGLIHGSFLSKSRLSILTENSSKVSAFIYIWNCSVGMHAVCLFVWLFIAARVIFQLSGGCNQYRWQGCKFGSMLSIILWLKQGSFYVPHLLWHRTSVLK